MESGEFLHHALVEVLLVGVDGLGMLAEIVEAGELLATVAAERPLAGVLPGGRWAVVSVMRGGTRAVGKRKRRV